MCGHSVMDFFCDVVLSDLSTFSEEVRAVLTVEEVRDVLTVEEVRAVLTVLWQSNNFGSIRESSLECM